MAKNSHKIVKSGPFILCLTSIVIIFVAEAQIMMLIGFLGLEESPLVALFDAAVLSVFVIPTLYFLFFKPMRDTILRLEGSERVQERLAEIDQLKSDFISVATHELSNPVRVIREYTELAIEEERPEQQKEFLATIQNKVQTLERLIEDFSIVNRLEAGENLEIHPEKSDLVKTVQHVCEVYSSRFPDLEIIRTVPDDPLILSHDATRISQVLDNLLSNAIKFSRDESKPIEVAVVGGENEVLIRVRDEGIGMSQGELDQVFDKFFRAESDKSGDAGLGIGMAIVRNIVDSHNGSIDIFSQKKCGTTVSITLPR